ncbi:fumarylacetoacetase [Massilia sp. RP-1-19]|uniref:fumarylacetoacetase n=1 Tax=Massilia polaris TaxID=2728846 RepID=A0A848HNK1_9BURK|nr:fumarylacetoacetase [Massilia polaris]NML60118.1 fumarylacetoacetase [Massilia polaris]
MSLLNETHAPALRSWVASANQPGADFPIQNLPFAVFRRAGSDETFRGGVAIGDQIVDLRMAASRAALSPQSLRFAAACGDSSLNRFMAMGPDAWGALRLALSRALRTGAPERELLSACLVPQSDAEYTVPAKIGDYTDFYTSIHHATSVGKLFRPESPLMPNYKWVPIGYHGRASSIQVSGQGFNRPVGQTMAPGKSEPDFGPCKRLDYELELGIYVGTGNQSCSSVPMDQAESHVFGLCLLNDWSARDVQAWEYQPLGPFLSKNFATTVSPWIVTLEALAPYRVPFARPEGDPQPLPYLDTPANRAGGAFDVQLQVLLESERMRSAGSAPAQLSATSYRHAYWTVAQLLAHHTVGGCNLQPGDLFGSGTLSGPTPDQAGALIELTSGGKEPLSLPDGDSRTYLLDGDTVIMRGWCEKPGTARIGFGECRGTVLPAKQS